MRSATEIIRVFSATPPVVATYWGAFGRLVGVIGALVMRMRKCYSQHVVGAECPNEKPYTLGFFSVYTRRHLENSLHPSSDGEY